MLISIVIPAYNESKGIETFHTSHLAPQLDKLNKYDFEVIYVNDGSKDNTLEILTSLAKNDKRVKVVCLSRNFGKEIAVTAGIHNANGDATIIMDADGQHPPHLIGQFVAKWQAGAQVVIGVRISNTKEGMVKMLGSKLFYAILNSTFGPKIIPGSTDYRLIDRVVRDEFVLFNERDRITRGLIDWLGFRRDYVYFDAPMRIAGKASYSVNKLALLGINSLTSLSLKPLFLFGWIGTIITVLSLLLGLFIIIEQVILGDPLVLNFTGPAMLGVFISFLVGLVLISQGIMALYLSHIHKQSQARPLFVIDRPSSIGIDKPNRQ